MTKVISWIVGAVLAILALAFWLSSGTMEWPRARLEAMVRDACHDCELSVRQLKPDLFNGSFRASDIRFQTPPGKRTRLDVRVDELTVTGNPWGWILGKPMRIDSIQVLKPSVKVIEDPFVTESNESGTPATTNGDWLKALPAARIEGVHLDEGTFVYELHTTRRGDIASIAIQNIDLDTKAFGTRPDLSGNAIKAELHAKVEHSGNLKLALAIDLYSAANHDEITLDLRDLDLSHFTHFFRKESGMALEGTLEQGIAELKMSQGVLTGSLFLQYHGLDLEFFKTPERNGIQTFLRDAGEELTVAGFKKANTPVQSKRAPGEGIVRVILNGLKAAARKIVEG